MASVANGEAAARPARVPYGTKQVSEAEAAQRFRQTAVCCPDRRGGNPLKRNALVLHAGAEAAIDSMASESPESVQQKLCVDFGMHTSRSEIETYRQRRFRAAGGRAVFIQKMRLASGVAAVSTADAATRADVVPAVAAATEAAAAPAAAAAAGRWRERN